MSMIGVMGTATCAECGAQMTTRSIEDRQRWLINHYETAHGRAAVDRRDEAVKEAIDKELARWGRAPSIDEFGREPIPIRPLEKTAEENAEIVKRVK